MKCQINLKHSFTSINSDLSVCYLIHLMFTEGRSPCDAVQYPYAQGAVLL